MTDRTRRVVNEPAYVLHRRPYRETSMIVDLLTPGFGRIGVVARGVRGGARRRGGASLEPFARLLIGCAGRGGLMTLGGAEVVNHRSLSGHALFAGLYLNELVVRLLRADDAHPALFDGYDAAVAALAGGAGLEPELRRFERLLLKESGYEVVFDADAETGEPVSAGRHYRYTPDFGFTRAQAAFDSAAVYEGAVLLAIAADAYEHTAVRRAAKRILRRALEPHLGDRPLQSRLVFAAVRR